MFDTRLVTSDCSKDYCIKWTLKDFSKLPNTQEIESPLFQPLPGYKWKFSLVNDGHILYLTLENKSEKRMTTEISLSVNDSDGRIWHHQEMSLTLKSGRKRDILFYQGRLYPNFNSLKDDIVIIICNFKLFEIHTTVITDHKIPTLQKNDSRMKLCADLKNLCKGKQHADVTFTVDGGQVLAHKVILCARSPVFDKMFLHPVAELEQGVVKIDDIDLPVFEKFVDFLYTGEIEVEDNIASTKALYYAADKYKVVDLRKHCADTLLSLLTVENIFGIMALANLHEDDYLKKGALDFVGGYRNSIVESETWDEFVSTETELAAEVLKYCARSMAITSSQSNLSSESSSETLSESSPESDD